MKEQLFEELSALHRKVAAIKVYDPENATALKRYAREYEALLTRLLTFNQYSFAEIAQHYRGTLPEGYYTDIDVHDDTTNDDGFYDSVSNLNNSINDAIEVINGL